jgi:hypothetical protein
MIRLLAALCLFVTPDAEFAAHERDGGRPHWGPQRGCIDVRLTVALVVILAAGCVGAVVAGEPGAAIATLASAMCAAFIQAASLARVVPAADAGMVPATHRLVRPGEGPEPVREGLFTK